MGNGQSSYADIDPVHALVGCINCHGGKEPASFDEAHASTSFISDPSAQPDIYCSPCHAQLVETNKNSMHTMAWGERTSIAERELGAGFDHTNFESCPDALVDGLETECSSCHTTCGQCHVSRPTSVHDGLIASHKFNATPDQNNNCLACHGSRISVDYKGTLVGNNPDVHYLKAMKCWDCHTEDMHADASTAPTRYHLADLPTCDNSACHSTGIETVNAWHTQHWPEDDGSGLSCYVCHSQPYYNCNSCHTEHEYKENYTADATTNINTGTRGYVEYPDFRIGYNYDQTLHSGKWIVVRHIPVSPDTYDNWDHATLANYDVRPTWEYTSPHNIRLYTAQTDTSGGADCSANCHLVGTNADQNAGLYLWQSLIDSAYSDEAAANASVTVDGRLPSGWNTY